MKYLSLFSGIGGFELGIQQAYEELCIKVKEQGVQGARDQEGQRSERHYFSADGLTCIGYSEIDKYAIQIYERHFPDHRNYGDINAIREDELPYFDLLCGGFPCQSFSIAGKRGGFADTRGTLFFDIARILQAKKPRLLLLENVKGLLSHDNGNTFKRIISTLDELGYDLQWQVLNSKNFGVPQNRERVFIVGHLRGTPRPEVFPIGIGEGINSKQDAQGNDVAHTLQCGDKHRGSYICEKPKIIAHYGHKNKNAVEMDISPTLKAQSHGHEPMVIKTKTAEAVNEVPIQVQSRNNTSIISDVLERRKDSIGRDRPVHYARHLDKNTSIRRLTPTECERLQGFPDGWTEGVSDTQRYKVLGNAVSVPVVKAIAERLLKDY